MILKYYGLNSLFCKAAIMKGKVQNIKNKFLFSTFLLFFFIPIIHGEENFQISDLKDFLDKNDWPKKWQSALLDSQLIVNSNVSSLKKNQQKMDFYILGLHKSSCTVALRKLSRYEAYENYLSYVKKSRYSEQDKEIYFQLDSPLLPVPMTLTFNLPRITQPGSYPFRFTKGMFKDLKGQVGVYTYQNRCLFVGKANWQGASTGYPAPIVEFFSEALSKIAMEKLFRISRL